VSGIDFVQWTNERLFLPAGTQLITPYVVNPSTEAYYYANFKKWSPNTPGVELSSELHYAADYSGTVAARGWYGSADEVLDILLRLRAGDPYAQAIWQDLKESEAGFFAVPTSLGPAHVHQGNSWLSQTIGGKSYQSGVATAVLSLPGDVDMVLLVNTQVVDAVDVARRAFQQWVPLVWGTPVLPAIPF
jgi:hypothetical protein